MKIQHVVRKCLNHDFFTTGSLEYHRVIHSIKTAIACIIGLGIARYFHLLSGQWISITIIVVMSAQIHFGAALQKAYMRFLGTMVGVGITIITLLFFGQNIFAMFAVVFIAALLFTYIASSSGNISYAGVLGGTTMLLTLTSADANVHFAAMRGFCIVIGIVIALLVSRFLFPIHAREKLRFNIAATLRSLRQLYFKTAQMLEEFENSNDAAGEQQKSDIKLDVKKLDSKLDKSITDNFVVQPQLIEEAAAGSRCFNLHKKSSFTDIVSVERKIYRLIYFIRKSLCDDMNVRGVIHKISSIEKLHVIIEDGLEQLAANLEDFSSPQLAIDFPQLQTMIERTAIKLPQTENTQTMLDQHSYLFFMEQLVKELESLSALVYKINITVSNGSNNETESDDVSSNKRN